MASFNLPYLFTEEYGNRSKRSRSSNLSCAQLKSWRGTMECYTCHRKGKTWGPAYWHSFPRKRVRLTASSCRRSRIAGSHLGQSTPCWCHPLTDRRDIWIIQETTVYCSDGCDWTISMRHENEIIITYVQILCMALSYGSSLISLLWGYTSSIYCIIGALS
mgnify:CR=1 FL=1